MKLSAETLEKNWTTFNSLLKSACGEKVDSLFDTFGERIIMCPLNLKEDQGGAYPGAMVEHALSLAMQMRKMNKSFNMEIDSFSIIKTALLHNIGRVGDENNQLFVNQDSDWHREKLGQMYKYNENIPKMSISHRTLYILQSFGIELTRDEWLAIQIAHGSHFEENRYYVNHEPSLAMLLQQSNNFINHYSRINK